MEYNIDKGKVTYTGNMTKDTFIAMFQEMKNTGQIFSLSPEWQRVLIQLMEDGLVK